MAKKAAKKPAPSTARGVPPKLPEPPGGGREAQGGQFNFWNPEEPGEVMLGTLAGIVQIKNQRDEDKKRFTLVKDKLLYVLPDHLNLMRLLEDVERANGSATGIKCWIQYQGEKEIEGVATPMKQYRVVDYGNQG